MPPQRPNLVLSSYIPDVKFHILVGHSLHVEADSGYRSDVLIELKFVENS